MTDPSLALKIGMIFVFFLVSLGGALLPICIPSSGMKDSIMFVLAAASAGVMVGVALVSIVIISSQSQLHMLYANLAINNVFIAILTYLVPFNTGR
jgi:lipid-binding SYLF domain-containing protein